MTTCVKQHGCSCRHTLRFYSRYLDDTIAAGETPKVDYLYSPDLLYTRDALYGMANCQCCPRHAINRPSWSDLVNKCPDLDGKNKKDLEILAVNKTDTDGETVTQVASVNVGGGQFEDDTELEIKVNNKGAPQGSHPKHQKACSNMNGNSFGQGAKISINVSNS